MERLKLLPFSQDSVEERVAAFRNFSDEVHEALTVDATIDINSFWHNFVSVKGAS